MTIAYIIGGLVIAAFLLHIARDRLAFELQIEQGQCRVSRGQLPTRLRQDLADALRDIEQGRVRARRQGDDLELETSGDIDDFTAQRLRNIVGIHRR